MPVGLAWFWDVFSHDCIVFCTLKSKHLEHPSLECTSCSCEVSPWIPLQREALSFGSSLQGTLSERNLGSGRVIASACSSQSSRECDSKSKCKWHLLLNYRSPPGFLRLRDKTTLGLSKVRRGGEASCLPTLVCCSCTGSDLPFPPR